MTTIEEIEAEVIAESVMKNWKTDPAVRVGFPDITAYHDWTVAKMAGFSDSFFRSNSDHGTLERVARHKWTVSPAIRKEFKTFGAFVGYSRAVCDGKIKVPASLQALFAE